MAGRLQRWIIRWILVAIAIAAGVTGLGPMVLTQMVSGDALLATATEALGRPVVARSASVTGTAFQPPRLILSEPRVGTIDEALLQAATVEVDLGWPALLGRGSPVAVTIVDGLVDLTALPAEMPSNGGLVPASGQLPRIRFTGDLRLPNGLDLTAVNLLGTPAPEGALAVSGTALAGNRPLDLNVVLRDPGPTASGLGGRISAEILDGDDSIALAGGFESGANPSFRGRLTLELQNPTPWVDLLGAPIPPGLDQLGGLKVDGLIYLAEDRIALSDAVWETPARAGSANLALEGVGEIEQLSGSISVNRFELADLGSLIDLESLAPRSAIGTLPIDIDLSADRFGLGPIEVADATLSLAVDPPGTVSLGSDALSIFDGTLRFQLSSRLGGDVPRIAGSLQLAGVPSIPVATALGSEGLFAEGIIDASITLNGQGGSWTDLATGLAGNGFVRVRDGTLAVDGVEGNRLTVSLAGGGFDVERGRITLRELRIDGPTAALTGPVTISLPAGNAVGRLSGGLDGEERTVAVSGTLGLPFMTLLPAPQ